jgi:NADPH:quinone reductase-like Zn-dependent oxidoreductase
MRAIAQDGYGDADVLELREVPRPTPGPREVLVEVRAAGVDPGVWHLMTGLPLMARPMIGLRRPRVAVRGRDLAGIVAEVGTGVTHVAPGDEVYGTCDSGSFAEFALAPATHIAPKPASVDFVQAAALPVSGMTALQAVRESGQASPGQRVMVIGAAGGVGAYAVQMAVARGGHVTGVCSGRKADLVRGLGASDVLDYTQQEVDARGPVYDVIIDTAGNRPLSLLRRALAPTGTLVLVGGESSGGSLFRGFDRQMRGPLLSLVVPQQIRGLMAGESVALLTDLAELVESGAVRPVIDRTFPLAQAPDALRHIADGHAAGKVVVTL